MVGAMKAQAMEINRVLANGREKYGLQLAMLQLHRDRGKIKARGLKNCERKWRIWV